MINSVEDCHHATFGGVSTSGDPSGTRRKLGLVEFPFRKFCWDCYNDFGRAWAASVAADTKQEIQARGLCGFVKAWIGECLNEKPCFEHAHERCWKCWKQATYQCDVAGSLVCGAPCCDEHPHPHGTPQLVTKDGGTRTTVKTSRKQRLDVGLAMAVLLCRY